MLNARLAKPILSYLVYSGGRLDKPQILAAARRFSASKRGEGSRHDGRNIMLRRTSNLASRALADQGERPPEGRVGIARRGGVGEIGQHRLAQRLGAAKFWLGLQAIESRGGEPRGSGRIDRPMRHQERPRTGIEERARQT